MCTQFPILRKTVHSTFDRRHAHKQPNARTSELGHHQVVTWVTGFSTLTCAYHSPSGEPTPMQSLSSPSESELELGITTCSTSSLEVSHALSTHLELGIPSVGRFDSMGLEGLRASEAISRGSPLPRPVRLCLVPSPLGSDRYHISGDMRRNESNYSSVYYSMMASAVCRSSKGPLYIIYRMCFCM